MAHFDSVGNFVTLAPGGTHHWDFWFGPGLDVGAALATPNINDPYLHIELVTSDLGVRTVQSREEGAGALIHYTVTVRNTGTVSVSYNLDLGHFQ
jgi:hypothetical protein